MDALDLVDPALSTSSSLAQMAHTGPSVNTSSTTCTLAPNDASIITLVAAEAKNDQELEAELKRSELVEPDGKDGHVLKKLNPVTGLIFRFHRQLQVQHGFPVDSFIWDQAVRNWSFLERTWGVRFTESYIARKALELLYAHRRSELDTKPFPFCRLPLELRHEVYRYVLAGDCRRILMSCLDMKLYSDDFERHQKHGGSPWYGDRSHPHWQNPSFMIRSARVGHGMGISTAILRVSRALHGEAEAFLYQLHEFDFYIDVFGVVPFLRSISHNARQNISCLTMLLHELSEIDVGPLSPVRLWSTSRQNLIDWGPACSYIAQNVRLQEFGGIHTDLEPPENFRQLSWVQDLLQIKSLQKLTCYQYYGDDWRGKPEREKLGLEDKDRVTTGIRARKQALLSYLESEMLASPAKPS